VDAAAGALVAAGPLAQPTTIAAAQSITSAARDGDGFMMIMAFQTLES